MYYLTHLREYLAHSRTMLTHGYRSIWYRYSVTLFFALCKIHPTNNEAKISVSSHTLYVPKNFVAILVISEIFIYDVYQRLHGLNHVLDLGGYIGDSAVYLSDHNTHVTVIESDPTNYTYLQKNVASLQNVTAHHAAIVASPEQKFFLIQDNEYRGTVSDKPSTVYPSKEIPTLMIQQLLEKNQFDGLKMDIEGGEYPLIDYFMSSGNFPFHKGFIEFHFFKQTAETQRTAFKKFLHFLGANQFFYLLYDNANHLTDTLSFLSYLEQHTGESTYINIYFEKDIVEIF